MSLNINNSGSHNYKYFNNSSDSTNTSSRNSYASNTHQQCESNSNKNRTDSCDNLILQASSRAGNHPRYSNASWDTQLSDSAATRHNQAMLNHNHSCANDYLNLFNYDYPNEANTFAIYDHLFFKLKPLYRSSYLTFNSNINKISNDEKSCYLEKNISSTMILANESKSQNEKLDNNPNLNKMMNEIYSDKNKLPLVPTSASSAELKVNRYLFYFKSH